MIEFPEEISLLNFPINRNIKFDLIKDELNKLKAKNSVIKVKQNYLFHKRLRSRDLKGRFAKSLNCERTKVELNSLSIPCKYPENKKKLRESIKKCPNNSSENIVQKKLPRLEANDKSTFLRKITEILRLKMFIDKIIISKSFSVKELIEIEHNQALSESSIRIPNSNIIPTKIKDKLDIRGDDDNPREFHYIFYNYLSRNKEECERKYNH